MCGLVGFVIKKNRNLDYFDHLAKMTSALKHRGPDDLGLYFDDNKKIGMGHTRLSIQDLSENGSQPMNSKSKRIILVFNGEIYNHLELRKKINSQFNINWTGTSDTETLIECIEKYGILKTLELIKGMFAFSFFDRKTNKLYLVRDKVGEKPLYYSLQNNNFFFASELHSFEKFQEINLELNIKSINLFTKYQYIPNPYSIYKKTFKLPPGSYLEFDTSKLNNLNDLEVKKWFDFKDLIINSKKNINNENEISLEKTLTKSIQDQLISDVPVGSFLSGGIDSSLITSIMSKISNNKISTFTIGLKDRKLDESIFAKDISRHLSTNHYEYLLTEKEVSDSVLNIISHYDEPFADSSQIPTNLLSGFAKKHVSVVLTGDGGDELFGGYNRYLWSKNLINFMKVFPFHIRKIIGKLLLNNPNIATFMIKKLFFFYSTGNLQSKIEKISSRLIKLKSPDDIYYSLITEWNDDDKLFDQINIEDNISFKKINELNIIENMMYFDSISYLTDDILYKVDRSSMNHGLECRAPFLDEDVITKAWQIPFTRKINNTKNGKLILQKILSKYIPNRLFDRPKMGFGIPLESWIKGDLKDFVYNSILSSDFKNFDLIDNKIVKKFFDEHMSNKRNWEHRLWSLVVLSNWLKKRKFI